jgi:D-3-phosphoglycerate dehydrogenase / 2-oxoglutarate reductase
VTEAVICAAPRLQVIGRYGIGVDNIAVPTATELGIPVTNVPAYCLDEVSDHALALILALARKVVRYDSALHAGNWDLAGGMPIHRLRGQTLGIVGGGKIGARLIPKAQALGLRVVIADPRLPEGRLPELGAECATLDDMLSQADFVTIHAPLTPETAGMLNASRLRLMKSTAFLINTARGGIIDQEALLQALRQGWIAGAALDVFTPERIPPDHPLLALPNVIATPHVAFYSEESVLDLELLAAQNVADVLAGRRPASVVNPEVLDLPRWAHLTSARPSRL